MEQRNFNQIINFSRLTAGTAVNQQGALVLFDSNQPRFDYDPTTLDKRGILVEDQVTNLVLQSSSYGISILFNALPSASNKSLYFFAEEKKAGGSWQIVKYSARKLELINAQETQLTITSARYYAVGTKIRFNIYGDATVTLKTTDLPGTIPGTVTLPAFRVLFAG